MARPTPWRVRTLRLMEVWVDVEATSSLEAETLAAAFPGVQSVFGRSAVPADRLADKTPPAGVLDDL